MRRSRTMTTAAVAVAAISVLATACTGQAESGANDDPKARTTINFWHGWSAPSEVKAVQDTIDRFEKTHPNITVNVVGNINDDKLNQALRAGGSNGPDVVSSFTTSNVGKFCSSGAFADLAPFIEKSGLDLEKTFPKVLLDYTQFEGDRCALPLLADAYGLYYNKDAFEKAGITAPPKTMSELASVAKKLTITKGDSYEQLGFMPTFHGYETVADHYLSSWDHTYFDADGKSNIAKDPAFAEMFTYQKKLVEDLGGYAKLEKYRGTFGDEWGSSTPSTPVRSRCSSTVSGGSGWPPTRRCRSRSGWRPCRSPTTRPTVTARASCPARSWASRRPARSRTRPGSW